MGKFKQLDIERMNKMNFIENPLVTIIVPTYNRKNLLPMSVGSLLNQTYKNIEIVIVNDFGHPVEDVVEKFKDDRVKLINHDKNMGLGAARNTGLRNSTGDYICLNDDDDIYYDEAIEFRLGLMKRFDADIVHTHSLKAIWKKYKGEDGIERYNVNPFEKVLYWHSDFDRDLILIQNISPCNTIMFSRKSFNDTGYWFDEEMTSTEDHDMWCALSRKYHFYQSNVIDCEATWRDDGSQMTGTRDFSKNWIKMFKRWRHTANNLEYVTNSQNEMLKRVGINPKDHGL